MDRKKPHSSRRNVLKTSGAALAAITGLGSASMAGAAKNDFWHHIEVADRIHERAGIEARTKYLRNHDIPTGYDEALFATSKSDGPATEKADCVEPDKCDGDIGVTLSISYNKYDGHYYVSSSVEMRYAYHWNYGMLSGGEAPNDGLGIQWGEDEWEVTNSNDLPSCTYGNDHIEWDNGSWNKQGVAFRVDDYGLCYDSGTTGYEKEWSNMESAGVTLNRGSDWEEGDSVTASYLHTWNETSTSLSFGVSFPWGISVSAGTTSSLETEDLQTDLDGKTLQVFESDVVY